MVIVSQATYLALPFFCVKHFMDLHSLTVPDRCAIYYVGFRLFTSYCGSLQCTCVRVLFWSFLLTSWACALCPHLVYHSARAERDAHVKKISAWSDFGTLLEQKNVSFVYSSQ